jgi:hypothetical protein
LAHTFSKISGLFTPTQLPVGSSGQEILKFLWQIQQITLQLNIQTQHFVPTKKVPNEKKQSSAAPAGEKRVEEDTESSHPGLIPILPSSSGLHLWAVFHPTSVHISAAVSQ